jgi:acetyl-CoA decarbonylase/synthase complex subunit delta
MGVELVQERWKGKLYALTIGREPYQVVAGGDSTLPFLDLDGGSYTRPVSALTVFDRRPENWPDTLTGAWGDVLDNPVQWARKCVELGADAVALKLVSAHPEQGDRSPQECAATVKAVAEAVDQPLIVLGCAVNEKDAAVLPVVSEALNGYNCLIGQATSENYKTVVAGCLAHGHSVIATSPLDINLAKQLNILMTDMNLPPDRIAMDPSIGPLGYGIEYAYSIIERKRTGALLGDRMLAMPVICLVGEEAWKVKEAQRADDLEWGADEPRGILWEAVTAVALAQAGASIFVFYHPEALRQFNTQIDALMGK